MAKSNANGSAPVVEAKRSASKSEYIGGAEPTRSPNKDAHIVRFTFDGIDTPVDLDINNLSDEIRHFAVLQGINIKLQRSYNTAKGNASQMYDECSATAQNLLDGVWTSEREGGLRVGDLAEAVQMVLASEGKTVELDAIKAKLVADEATRTKAKENVKVQANLTAIVARKAAERAAVAGKAAESHVGESGLDF